MYVSLPWGDGSLLRLLLGLGALAGGLLGLGRFLALGLFGLGGLLRGGLLLGLGRLFRLGGLLGLLLHGNAALGDDAHSTLAAQVSGQTGDIDGLRYVLGLHAVGFSELLILGLQILFGDLDILGFGDGGEQDLGAGLLFGGGAHALAEGLHIGADHLEIIVDADALVGHVLGVLADNAVHTLFNHAFGHINGHVLHSLIDEGVVKGVLRGLFLLLNRLGADVGLEIGERVKVVVLRELVVQSMLF